MGRGSFARRLVVAFAGVGVAAAAMTALLVNLAFGGRFSSYLEQQQGVRQEQLVAALSGSYRRMGGWEARDLERIGVLALTDGGTLRLVDPAGRTVWQAGGQDGGMAGMHHGMMGAVALGPEQRLPVEVDRAVVATAVVRFPAVGVLPADRAFRASVNRLLLLGGITAALAALAFGLLLARRATAPARALGQAATALAAGDRSRRVPEAADEEFGEMVRAFNQMADRIEAEDRLRREFASSVAHELRTPLTILRTQVEAIQDGVVAADPGTLASLHEEILRTGRLIGDLETLGAAAAAGFSLDRRRVELRPLLEDATREFAGPFEARGVRLETRLADLVVPGDPVRLRQVVANLLSNALKFTPPGGLVRVELAGGDEVAVITVADSGPGIAPDELPRVFDRFFRGRGVRAGGSGIGLSVVWELVGAHGGEVDVASDPGRGATFTVRLPAVAASVPRRSFTASS
jgi:signal transduction histidine kinase